jgi:hypothetical protein
MFRRSLFLCLFVLASSSIAFAQAKSAHVVGTWKLNFTKVITDGCGAKSDLLGKLKFRVITGGDPVIGVYGTNLKTNRSYWATLTYHGVNSKGSYFRAMSDGQAAGRYIVYFGFEFWNAKNNKTNARQMAYVVDTLSPYSCVSVVEGKGTK